MPAHPDAGLNPGTGNHLITHQLTMFTSMQVITYDNWGVGWMVCVGGGRGGGGGVRVHTRGWWCEGTRKGVGGAGGVKGERRAESVLHLLSKEMNCCRQVSILGHLQVCGFRVGSCESV